MAQILVVSTSWNSTTEQLCRSLLAQQHEVSLLTSKNQEIKTQGLLQSLQILSYFKKWVFTEALRLTPLLLRMRPQVIHLMLDHEEFPSGMWYLSLFAKSLPGCVLTTSFLHLEKDIKHLLPLKILVQESDIITGPSTSALAQLRGMNIRSPQQGRGLLPPTLQWQSSSSHDYSPVESLLITALKNFKKSVALPFFSHEMYVSNSSYNELIQSLKNHSSLVFLGSWPTNNKNLKKSLWNKLQKTPWVLTGTLNNDQLQSVLQRCEVLFLAGLDLNTVELIDWINLALKANVALVIDNKQSRVYQNLWKNQINCWILPLNEEQKIDSASLQHWMQRDTWRLPEDLAQNIGEQKYLLDSPFNELNRLYMKALAQKNRLSL